MSWRQSVRQTAEAYTSIRIERMGKTIRVFLSIVTVLKVEHASVSRNFLLPGTEMLDLIMARDVENWDCITHLQQIILVLIIVASSIIWFSPNGPTGPFGEAFKVHYCILINQWPDRLALAICASAAGSLSTKINDALFIE